MTACQLCDLPADDAVTADGVEGAFCCRGCLEVYRTLDGVEAVERSDRSDDSRVVPDEAATAYFAMDGMHCSTCETYLESVARDRDGVYEAQASYAAQAVKVDYDPEAVTEADLRATLSRTGYTARGREADAVGTDDTDDLEDRLIVGAVLGMMAMLTYVVFLYPTYFGYDPLVPLGTDDSAHVYGHLAALAGVLLLYTGAPVLRGAYVSLRTRSPNVDLLVTVAAFAAYGYSTGSLLAGQTDLYYDVTVVVVLAVTAGNYYEDRIRSRMSGLITDLAPLRAETATLETGETVQVDAVQAGDRLLVRPGERVPVDGTVREGSAAVDEALVTGESLPETKASGDRVVGGAVVTDAPLVVRATGSDSTLDHIVESLWEVQASRSGAQRLADRLATVFVPLVLTVATLVSGWLLVTGRPPRAALLTGLTVVIVSCPCALGLATPLAVASGLTSAANRGVVVTTTALFEHVGSVDTVVFDKTGTLTDGAMTVRDVFAAEGVTEERLLSRAGAVERYAAHPVARAITAAAPEMQPDGGRTVETVPPVGEAHPSDERSAGSGDCIQSFERHATGVSATVDGDRVLVGHPELFDERGYAVPGEVERRATREERGVPVVVGWESRARGVVRVGDEDRDGWAVVADELGDRTVVLTGDDGPTAETLREHHAVDRVFAGIKPDGKAETVRQLAETGTVAMVGDGSNDAPALAAADVGIALDEGTELATSAADAVVLDSDLRRLPEMFEVAGATRRRIRENLAWAFVYNAVAIPLAATGLLNPLFAAVAMATSSFLVVANSARTTG